MTIPVRMCGLLLGTGKNFTHIHINEICNALGEHQSIALPVFHSFTGCDTTCAFFGKGKKSAWEAWKSYLDVTQAFLSIARLPHNPVTTESLVELLECYTVVLYDKTSCL